MHYNVLVIHHNDINVSDILTSFNYNLKVEKKVDEETQEIYWSNPNAKLDWYEIGGRWRGRLKLKDNIEPTDEMYGPQAYHYKDIGGPYFPCIGENYVDSAPLKYIDFSLNKKEYKDSLKQWDEEVNKYINDDKDVFYLFDAYIRNFISKEFYAYIESEFWFRYVITPDNQWHELPEKASFVETLDWISSFYKNFIFPYLYKSKENLILTSVDIHY